MFEFISNASSILGFLLSLVLLIRTHTIVKTIRIMNLKKQLLTNSEKIIGNLKFQLYSLHNIPQLSIQEQIVLRDKILKVVNDVNFEYYELNIFIKLNCRKCLLILRSDLPITQQLLKCAKPIHKISMVLAKEVQNAKQNYR